MTVRLNLLPQEFRPVEKSDKINLSRIVALSLVLAVFLVGGTVLVVGVLRSYSLKAKIREIDGRKEALTLQFSNMTSELERLKKKETLISATLTLLRGDLPLLELFRQIELSLPDGVWLSSVKTEPGKAYINGFSYNENDVVLFATGLMESPVVAQVGFPNTRRIAQEGDSLVEFRLVCITTESGLNGGKVSP